MALWVPRSTQPRGRPPPWSRRPWRAYEHAMVPVARLIDKGSRFAAAAEDDGRQGQALGLLNYEVMRGVDGGGGEAGVGVGPLLARCGSHGSPFQSRHPVGDSCRAFPPARLFGHHHVGEMVLLSWRPGSWVGFLRWCRGPSRRSRFRGYGPGRPSSPMRIQAMSSPTHQTYCPFAVRPRGDQHGQVGFAAARGRRPRGI
jgi:hypothetical protein